MLGGGGREGDVFSPSFGAEAADMLCPRREEGERRESSPGPGLVFPLSPTLVLSVFQSRKGKALTQLSRTQSLILGKEKREEAHNHVWKVNIQPVAWCLGSSIFPLSLQLPRTFSQPLSS